MKIVDRVAVGIVQQHERATDANVKLAGYRLQASTMRA